MKPIRARPDIRESQRPAGERLYRDIVENTLGSVCIHELDGTIIAANAQSARSLEYEIGELEGMNLRDVLAPEVRHQFPEYLERVERDGVASGYMRARSKNGAQRIWYYRNALRDDGEYRYVIGQAFDVTEQKTIEWELRKARELLEARVDNRTRELEAANATLQVEIAERGKAEAALRKHEERFRAILETTRVIPWEADAKTWRFTYVGPQAVELLGYPIEDWYREDFRFIHIVPEDRQLARELFMEKSAACDHYELEYRMEAADGRIVWIQDLVSVECSRGEAETLRGFWIDITARKNAEEEARQLRQRIGSVARLTAMGEMAAGIAHEVNQPLSAIATYTDATRRLVESGELDRSKLTAAMERLGAEALRAGEIIQRFRDLISKREIKKQSCDVNELIREVCRFASADTRWGNIVLQLELNDSLNPVLADPVQIQQVVLNLMRNGAESMRAAGTSKGALTVTTAPFDGGAVQVSVKDQGGGVSEQSEQHLFSPFFTTKEAGLGLGLSLSQSIIDAHRGRIWFTRNDEAGITFHFVLPAAESGRKQGDP